MENIVLLSFDFPPLSGGISRLCHELAIQLAISKPGRFMVLTETFKNVSGVKEKEDYDITRVTGRRPAREWQTYKYLRNLPASIIICATWYPEGLIALFSRKHKVVILAHGTEILPARSRLKQPLWQLLGRWVLQKSNLVICNSHFTAGLARTLSPNCLVETLPLAVDIKKFSPMDKKTAKKMLSLKDKITLLTVARLHRYKGVETVLSALSKLSPQEKNRIQYLIAGKGPYQQTLAKLTKDLGIETQVSFLGSLSEPDLVRYYQASDLFLLCSWYEREEQNVEGFGLVFLEAQSCGTAVIGTNSGGIPDAIESAVGGWLIGENDSDSLAAILKGLLSNPNELITQGIKARERVEGHFTFERYRENFLSLFEKHKI